MSHKYAQQIEIIARGLIQSGSKILLCKSIDRNYMYLPGGHVEFCEPAQIALEREMREETGLSVTAGPLLLTHEHTFTDQKGRAHHEINLVFHVEHTLSSDCPVPSSEADIAFEWIEVASIVDLDIRPVGVRAFIAAGVDTDVFLSECTL
ncbi:MAG: NUDIX domain-containing protein [Phycisphaeraceae bacterium]|nr:NUDIX domain-containing protein [Phycisphaerales bacterium]MCB9859829.1 NUDIX domain-containing protein [Phycisphaeraceae bacterium]